MAIFLFLRLAAYSASVLHRIGHNKPADYRRRLSAELRQSLFDGGILSAEPANGVSQPPHLNDSSLRYASPKPLNSIEAMLNSAQSPPGHPLQDETG
ncbi:unnamed protein product [Protopolystoma xenopodis]|uniref:Uncharacterized protein n=1 Tax=Protopolystoma xenopodis TaxID=117903 RepID=A0A3S5CVB0_9PLAT|nr:unnamed protein product [Protopolystoma xenopodis]